MIKRYTDHSANERTYLAWIRTAIAIMAFGFLIEKFDLFIETLRFSVGGIPAPKTSGITEMVGVGLFLMGIILIVLATWRFFDYKKHIEAEADFHYDLKYTNLILSILMVMVGGILLAYLIRYVL
jgi:putative membrane protein